MEVYVSMVVAAAIFYCVAAMIYRARTARRQREGQPEPPRSWLRWAGPGILAVVIGGSIGQGIEPRELTDSSSCSSYVDADEELRLDFVLEQTDLNEESSALIVADVATGACELDGDVSPRELARETVDGLPHLR